MLKVSIKKESLTQRTLQRRAGTASASSSQPTEHRQDGQSG